MGAVGKAVLLCIAATIVPLFAGIVATAIVAGSTSKLGASAVGPWLVGLLVVQLGLFAGSSAVLFKLLGPLVAGAGRAGLFFVHVVVQLGLLGLLAFVSVVVFNR